MASEAHARERRDTRRFVVVVVVVVVVEHDTSARTQKTPVAQEKKCCLLSAPFDLRSRSSNAVACRKRWPPLAARARASARVESYFVFFLFYAQLCSRSLELVNSAAIVVAAAAGCTLETMLATHAKAAANRANRKCRTFCARSFSTLIETKRARRRSSLQPPTSNKAQRASERASERANAARARQATRLRGRDTKKNKKTCRRVFSSSSSTRL